MIVIIDLLFFAWNYVREEEKWKRNLQGIMEFELNRSNSHLIESWRIRDLSGWGLDCVDEDGIEESED